MNRGLVYRRDLMVPPQGLLTRECLRAPPMVFPRPGILLPSRQLVPATKPWLAAITLVGTAKNGGQSTALSITLPTLQENDVVYVAATAASIPNPAFTTPSGYTSIISRNAGARQEAVWRKVMGASPDSTVTINVTNNPFISAIAICLRGVDTATPEDASATSTTGTSGAPNSPSITTVTNGAWVLTIGCGGGTAATAAPTNYGNLIAQASAGPNNSTQGATREISSAGAEDPSAFTGGTSTNWGAYTLAVRPAAQAQPYAKRGARVPGMLGAPGFARPGWNKPYQGEHEHGWQLH
jgi:hypothetical protein